VINYRIYLEEGELLIETEIKSIEQLADAVGEIKMALEKMKNYADFKLFTHINGYGFDARIASCVPKNAMIEFCKSIIKSGTGAQYIHIEQHCEDDALYACIPTKLVGDMEKFIDAKFKEVSQ
jgi:hypothetical protein